MSGRLVPVRLSMANLRDVFSFRYFLVGMGIAALAALVLRALNQYVSQFAAGKEACGE
jgi:hypothetical protein